MKSQPENSTPARFAGWFSFSPMHKQNHKKPKELFFVNTRTNIETAKIEIE